LKNIIFGKFWLNDEIRNKLTFTKELRPEIRNKKNKDWSWNTNNQEGQVIILGRRERKKKGSRWQTRPPSEICIALAWKGYSDVFNNTIEGYC